MRNNLPETWVPGIAFCSKGILRLGIILYGFRLTFQDVFLVGLPAVLIDVIIVTGTILLGIFLGRLLKIDRSIALLTACGSGICGAAAVLGVDGAIRPQPYKTAVSVATVVIFGTLSMFVYPVMFRMGFLHFTPEQMGLYTGSTLHEVAHVVGAGNAMNAAVSNTAVIVKMIRVMMLVPVLLIVTCCVGKGIGTDQPAGRKRHINIPWFALLFLVVIGFNSMQLLPANLTDGINTFDTFLLTMAMTALGAETGIDRFKRAGYKPFFLASLLYVWLVGGGYLFTRYLAPVLM